MNGLVLVGAFFLVAGLALLLDVAGAGTQLIHRVTSRSLGSLAPGFAATRRGLRTYAVVLASFGVLVCGLGVGTAGGSGYWVAILVGAGAAGFVLASVVAIRGEIETYRGLRR